MHVSNIGILYSKDHQPLLPVKISMTIVGLYFIYILNFNIPSTLRNVYMREMKGKGYMIWEMKGKGCMICCLTGHSGSPLESIMQCLYFFVFKCGQVFPIFAEPWHSWPLIFLKTKRKLTIHHYIPNRYNNKILKRKRDWGQYTLNKLLHQLSREHTICRIWELILHILIDDLVHVEAYSCKNMFITATSF